MASFLSFSSPPSLLSRCSPHLPPISSFPRSARLMVLPAKCLSSGPDNSEPETSPSPSPSPPPSSSSWSSNSTYKWCAGLGSVGFIETTYLTYLKLTDSDAFCPIGGGSCSSVLDSDYAVVFGVPLPLFGMAAYGLVATLSFLLYRKSLPLGIDETNGRLILLGSTTAMAAASACFLYILSTSFPRESCSYCLLSAMLSFSLFFIALKDYGLQEIQKVVGLPLCIAGLVVAALSTSYSNSLPVSSSLAEVDLQPFTVEITTESSPLALSLAKHLHSIGAKMYGAFWCSHCVEQKQMFGREAAKVLDYVECFPNGYRKGTKIAKACSDVGIEGFPTWVVNGQVLSGELELPELARVSEFNLDELSQPS